MKMIWNLSLRSHRRTYYLHRISEMCGYLEHNGFTAELRLDWPERNISINTEYMMRIFDNISSNLMKYADRSYNIDVETVCCV